MDHEELSRLRALDWDEIAAKLLLAAVNLATRYGWGHDSSLPRGKGLEDVVIETISDIWDNPQRLKPGVDVLVQLRGIVKSKLWNLSQSPDEDIARSGDLAEIVGTSTKELSDVETVDEFERAIQLLLHSPKVKGNEELELVVLAMSCGAMDTEEIARETQFSRERIYQLRRELRHIYPTIAKLLRNNSQEPQS